MKKVNESMTVKEIKEVADQLQVEYKSRTSKPDLIEMVNSKVDALNAEADALEAIIPDEEPAHMSIYDDANENPALQEEEVPVPGTTESIMNSLEEALDAAEAAEAPAEAPAEEKEKAPGKRELEAKQIAEIKEQPEVQAVLNSDSTKAEKIRKLLAGGMERKHVAKIMECRYQMVYQVEQRMLESLKKDAIREQAVANREKINNMSMKDALEEFGEEIVAMVGELEDEEGEE